MGGLWEAVQSFANLAANWLTALSAAYAAYKAAATIDAWRREKVGSARLEVAAEALSDVYEARDRFRAIRSPGSFAIESKDRPRDPEEDDETVSYRNAYWSTIKRIIESSDFFARCRERKYKAIAIFGLEASEIYDEIWSIQAEIMSSAEVLLMMGPPRRENENTSAARARRERIIWAISGDEISNRMDGLVARAEAKYRPEIDRISKELMKS